MVRGSEKKKVKKKMFEFPLLYVRKEGRRN